MDLAIRLVSGRNGGSGSMDAAYHMTSEDGSSYAIRYERSSSGSASLSVSESSGNKKIFNVKKSEDGGLKCIINKNMKDMLDKSERVSIGGEVSERMRYLLNVGFEKYSKGNI